MPDNLLVLAITKGKADKWETKQDYQAISNRYQCKGVSRYEEFEKFVPRSVGALKGTTLVVVIGHSDGRTIQGVTSDRLGQSLLEVQQAFQAEREEALREAEAFEDLPPPPGFSLTSAPSAAPRDIAEARIAAVSLVACDAGRLVEHSYAARVEAFLYERGVRVPVIARTRSVVIGTDGHYYTERRYFERAPSLGRQLGKDPNESNHAARDYFRRVEGTRIVISRKADGRKVVKTAFEALSDTGLGLNDAAGRPACDDLEVPRPPVASPLKPVKPELLRKKTF